MEIVKYGVYLNDSKLNVLVKEDTFHYGSEFFNKPEIIVDMLNAVFHAEQQAEEHVWMLAMNNSCEVLGVFEVCHGSVSESHVHMREIFVRLCLCGATRFILAHNHPGNRLVPSEADISMTERVSEAATLMDIKLLEHLIICKNGYVSFVEEGLIGTKR